MYKMTDQDWAHIKELETNLLATLKGNDLEGVRVYRVNFDSWTKYQIGFFDNSDRTEKMRTYLIGRVWMPISVSGYDCRLVCLSELKIITACPWDLIFCGYVQPDTTWKMQP